MRQRLGDIFLTSIISLFFTFKCYGFLYDKMHWSGLADFYAGISIFTNHNKYLDIYIYFIYLALFFIILPAVSAVHDKFNKIKKAAPDADSTGNTFNMTADSITAEKLLQTAMKYQYLFLAGFIFLHPLNGVFYPKIAALILLLIIISAFDIYRRNKDKKGFSPFAIAAFFFIFCFSSYTINTAPADDHHFGERFAAFFLHNNFNLEYYKDVMLVHGRMDTAGSLLGSFFFNMNNIEGYWFGEVLQWNIIFLITMTASLFIFNCNIIYAAASMMLHTRCISIMFVSAFVLLLKENILNKPALWFWIYITLAVLFFSYWTTIGGFWITASIPAFIYIVFKLPAEKRKKHLYAAAAVFLALSIIFRNSFFEFWHQAEYYIKGTLPVFGNGFEYKETKLIYKAVFEWAYKMSALFFTPVIILELCSRLKNRKKEAAEILFFVFALLFVLSSLKYSLGRLDNGVFSRIEFISLPFLCIIIPYWFYKFSSSVQKLWFERISAVILAGVLIYSSVFIMPKKIKLIGKPAQAETSKLFNTGNINIDEKHKARLEEVKEYLYSKDENETFLDLTNRGMHYVYFNKSMPVQFTSFYNSIASMQAYESMERIKKNPPDNILIASDNILHDYIFPSMRINPLYRYILLKGNYRLETLEKNALLVKTKDRYEFTQQELSGLDYYMSPKKLYFLPEVWAASINTLPAAPVLADYSVQNYGREIKIRFTHPQEARNYDLLYLNINKTGKKPVLYTISMNSSNSKLTCLSKSGKILVPLDNYPSWLLNNNLTEITIETSIDVQTPEIKFYNRKINHRL